jgi:hypothetical protein
MWDTHAKVGGVFPSPAITSVDIVIPHAPPICRRRAQSAQLHRGGNLVRLPLHDFTRLSSTQRAALAVRVVTAASRLQGVHGYEVVLWRGHLRFALIMPRRSEYAYHTNAEIYASLGVPPTTKRHKTYTMIAANIFNSQLFI